MNTKILAITAAATVAAFGSIATADPVISSNISEARALHAAGIARPLESVTLRNGAEVKSVARGERMMIIAPDPANTGRTSERFTSSSRTETYLPGSHVHTKSRIIEEIQDAQTGGYKVGRDDRINLGG